MGAKQSTPLTPILTPEQALTQINERIALTQQIEHPLK